MLTRLEVEAFNVFEIFFVHTSTLCNTFEATFCLNHPSTTDLWRAQLRFCQQISFCSRCVLCPLPMQLQAQAGPYQREEIALRFEKKMMPWQLTFLKIYQLVIGPYWNLTLLMAPDINLVIGQLGNGSLVNMPT